MFKLYVILFAFCFSLAIACGTTWYFQHAKNSCLANGGTVAPVYGVYGGFACIPKGE